MRIHTVASCLALLAFTTGLAAQDTPAALSLKVGIVGENLDVKPVPLHEVRFTPAAGGNPLLVRTSLDGTASVTLAPGRYAVTSASPVIVNGMSYQWSLTVTVTPGPGRLELTNANATTSAVSAPSSPGVVHAQGVPSMPVLPARQMAPEMEVYQQVRAGVFRIESGLAHGSGFLVDTAGFILTNAHVVAGQMTAAAVLDSATRIAVQIVHRDNDRDIAVLRAAPSMIRSRPVLRLGVGSPLVEPGERVFAIGYPLHQEQTLTSGIVSSVREAAIISDVNINQGNSGGPLLNLAGEVVAINTFGDLPSQVGPGISGSVLITRALEPLSEGRGKAAALPIPSEETLPLVPTGRFSTQALKAFADSVKPNRYAIFDSIGVGKFFVTVTTPPIAYVRQKAFEQLVGKDRKKREARAKLDEEARFSEMRELRDWLEYVGDQRAPVVALTIEPRIGETSGSVFRRLLLTGARGKATIRYAGDLENAFIFRNGEPVSILKGGTTPVKQYIDNQWIDLKDVANYGYYVVPADAFAPDGDGTPPSIVIELADLKNPTIASCRELPGTVVATVWNDFVLYYAALGQPFTAADPKRRSANTPSTASVCAASRTARGAPAAEEPAPSPMGGSPMP